MQSGNYNLLDLNKLQKDDAYKIVFPYHMTALALNKEGLKNMFKIVSEANTTYFEKTSRIPRERLEFYREGLLFGSGCYNSEIFDLAMTRSLDELKQAMAFYDYIEIMPLDTLEDFCKKNEI